MGFDVKILDELGWLRFIGMRTYLEKVRYSIGRDQLEKRMRKGNEDTKSATAGRFQGVEDRPHGAAFAFENASLEVRFLAPTTVRVEWSAGTPPFLYAHTDDGWPHPATKFEPSGTAWHVSSPELGLVVNSDGEIEFRNRTGELLRRDLGPLWENEGWQQQASLLPETQIHGLGGRASPLNLRGGRFRMWNTDPNGSYGPGIDPLYICIPAYLSVQEAGSYMVFYENSHDGWFSFNDNIQTSFIGGQIVYYVISGTLSMIYEQFGRLTGFPPLPPRWALGYHQSRFSYDSAAEVRGIAEGFRERDLPLSVIHLDIDYMDEFRVFTFDRERFADVAGLARELAKSKVRLVAILNPGIKRDRGFDVYQDGLKEDVFVKSPNGKLVNAPVWPGVVNYPDFTDPKARSWWGKHYASMLKAGIRGFWHDMNEPVAFAAWGDPTLPLNARHSLEGQGGDHRQAHNLYGLRMNQAAFEALRELAPDHRPWLLTRAGWAGIQRYAWNWTGDTESSWRTLRQTVATVLGLSLTGVTYAGPDIGGFSGSPSAELYLRWFQLGAFLPFFRTHSGNRTARREPWCFGEDVLDAVREVLRLRYRLMPYLYTLAWQASQKGLPIIRPLFWLGAAERDLWEVDDAFLLGDSLLVAPVLDQGARSRDLLLPAGRWYELSSDIGHEGGGHITLAAPLSCIPVLVRAGSVLPTEQDERLTLDLFAPESGGARRILYSDAGDGYGVSRLDTFLLKREADRLTLSWESDGGFGFPYSGVELRVHGFAASRAEIDGRLMEYDTGVLMPGPFRLAIFYRRENQPP